MKVFGIEVGNTVTSPSICSVASHTSLIPIILKNLSFSSSVFYFYNLLEEHDANRKSFHVGKRLGLELCLAMIQLLKLYDTDI